MHLRIAFAGFGPRRRRFRVARREVGQSHDARVGASHETTKHSKTWASGITSQAQIFIDVSRVRVTETHNPGHSSSNKNLPEE